MCAEELPTRRSDGTWEGGVALRVTLRPWVWGLTAEMFEVSIHIAFLCLLALSVVANDKQRVYLDAKFCIRAYSSINVFKNKWNIIRRTRMG